MPEFLIVHYEIKGIVMARVEAEAAGDALASTSWLDLPKWTMSCPIQEQDDGTAVIEHPNEVGHYIVAKPA